MTEKISDEMLAFSDRLARERAARQLTGIASKSFIDRMTSSAADPKAAEAESEATAAAVPPATAAVPPTAGKEV